MLPISRDLKMCKLLFVKLNSLDPKWVLIGWREVDSVMLLALPRHGHSRSKRAKQISNWFWTSLWSEEKCWVWSGLGAAGAQSQIWTGYPWEEASYRHRHSSGTEQAQVAHISKSIFTQIKKGMNCCVQIIANQFKDTKTIIGNFFKFNHNFQNQKFSYLTLKKIEGWWKIE